MSFAVNVSIPATVISEATMVSAMAENQAVISSVPALPTRIQLEPDKVDDFPSRMNEIESY